MFWNESKQKIARAFCVKFNQFKIKHLNVYPDSLQSNAFNKLTSKALNVRVRTQQINFFEYVCAKFCLSLNKSSGK